jgi:hypothetical protein
MTISNKIRVKLLFRWATLIMSVSAMIAANTTFIDRMDVGPLRIVLGLAFLGFFIFSAIWVGAGYSSIPRKLKHLCPKCKKPYAVRLLFPDNMNCSRCNPTAYDDIDKNDTTPVF